MLGFRRVRIFSLGMFGLALTACAQPYESKPNFFQDGYSESRARAPAQRAADGRSTIKVYRGDTLYSLARRYRTSVGELASANGLFAPYALTAGQTLVLPGTQTALAPPPSARKAAPRPQQRARVHVVRPKETLYRISVNNNTSVQKLAQLNGIRAPYSLAVGQTLRLPGMTDDTATGAIAPPPGQAKRADTRPVERKTARIAPPPQKTKSIYAPSRRYRSSNAKFIWPVEGRVISRFGGKATGLRNDGINIKTDAGAPVRAASEGIVTYAGNELRGYGNLLLVKHPDGYITAYAHNSELLVKKGAKVHKGQVIAAVGETGSVTEPQLHFEIRKGSKAMNPEKYLGK